MSEKVYICSAYKGDVNKNLTAAKEHCKLALQFGFNPICPHLYYPQFLNDDVPIERQRARVLCLEMMLDCKKVWVFGDEITEGMMEEMKFAQDWNIPIYRKVSKDGPRC